MTLGENSPRVQRQPPLWQDRETRFDVSARELALRVGEHVLYRFDLVEDTKGNAGDLGRIQITNLRVIWQSSSKPRINLTIGLHCVCAISKKQLHSDLHGTYCALHILCKTPKSRFEFVFTQMAATFTSNDAVINSARPISLEGQPDDLIGRLGIVCRAYGESRLFRDLRLRAALFTGSGQQLKLLPDERVYRRVSGVWNLSADQGNLGTMQLTDVRIVWAANLNDLFNLSLPYVQVTAVRVRQSKFGLALVIESSELSGGYVLGFRLDPPERLHSLHNELVHLLHIHTTRPSLGVERVIGSEVVPDSLPESPGKAAADEVSSFVQSGEQSCPDAIAAYLADEQQTDSKNTSNSVEYNEELGLTIERIRNGFTLQQLWNVIVE